MTGVWAGACVAVATLLLARTPRSRLETLLRSGPPAAGDPPPGRATRPHAPDCATPVAELATLLRAGLPPARAWQVVAAAPGRGEHLDAAFDLAAEAEAGGADPAAALRAAVDGVRDQDLVAAVRALAAAWQVAARVGAPPAAVLERLAVSLRSETDLRDATATAMAAPRATARVLAGLPLVGLALGQLVGASPLTWLAGTTAGRACGVTGAVLAGLAWWWARRLVRGAMSRGAVCSGRATT